MATSSNQAPESGIIRTVHDRSNQFAQINRALLQNSTLSWEARGVLSYLLSKPEDWEVRFTDLVKQGPGEADRMRRILKELERSGHMIRNRDHGPDGRWRWVTLVFENPADAAFAPYADFPYMDKPHAEKPDTEKRHIKKEQKRTNTEVTNTEVTNTREATPAPAIVAIVPGRDMARDIAPTGRKLTPGVNAPKPIPATALPRDWAFDPALRDWAINERGLTPDQADDEHEGFCAYYFSMAHDKRRGWRSDWAAVEHGWFLKRNQFVSASQQKGRITHDRTYDDPDAINAEIQAAAAAARAAERDVPGYRAAPVPLRRRA